MTYSSRISHLKRMHEEIDRKIDLMERNHPHVSEVEVHDMKKQRLLYRDELSKLRRLQYEESQRVGYGDDR